MRPRNRVLGGARIPQGKGNFGGSYFGESKMGSASRDLQKRMNRSTYPLGCDSGGFKKRCIKLGATSRGFPHEKG